MPYPPRKPNKYASFEEARADPPPSLPVPIHDRVSFARGYSPRERSALSR
jgi:hypothetical protein